MPEQNELELVAALLAAPAEGALEVLEEFGGDVPWLQRALGELELMPLEEWQAEHTRLFVTGYPRTPCPPFESAYRHGTMEGKAAQELTALYAEAGLGVDEGMPADFLPTTLACAGFVAQELGRDSPVWAGLWRDHLLRWVPDFARDLQNHSQLMLYRAVAGRLEALCDEAQRRLAAEAGGD